MAIATASAANTCGFPLAPKSKTTRSRISPALRIVREAVESRCGAAV